MKALVVRILGGNYAALPTVYSRDLRDLLDMVTVWVFFFFVFFLLFFFLKKETVFWEVIFLGGRI